MATGSTKFVATRTSSVFVGHLLQTVTKEDLFEVFKTCGKICKIFIFDGKNDAYKYGFVNFENRDAAIKATQELNKWPLKGTPMKVDLSKETKLEMQREGFLDVNNTNSHTNQDVRSEKKAGNPNYGDDVLNLSRLRESCSSYNLEAAQSGCQKSIDTDSLLDDVSTVNCGIFSTKAELIDYNPIDLHNLSRGLMNGEFGKTDQNLTEKETQNFFMALDVIMDSVKGFTTFCRHLNSQEKYEDKKSKLHREEVVEDDVANCSSLDPAQVKAKLLEDGLKQLLFSKKKGPCLPMEENQATTVLGSSITAKESVSKLNINRYVTENPPSFDSEDKKFDNRSCFYMDPNHKKDLKASNKEHRYEDSNQSLPLEIKNKIEDSIAGTVEDLSESLKISSLTELIHLKRSDKTNTVPESNSPTKTVSLTDLLKNSERAENPNKAVKHTIKNTEQSNESRIKKFPPSTNQQLGILGPAPNSLSMLGPVSKLHSQHNGLLGSAPSYHHNVSNVTGFHENLNHLKEKSSKQDGILGPVPVFQSIQKGPAPNAKIYNDHRLVSGLSTVKQSPVQNPITSLRELPCEEWNPGEKSVRTISQLSKKSLGLSSPSRTENPVSSTDNDINSLNSLLSPGPDISSMKSGGRGNSGGVAAANKKLSLNSLSSQSSLKSDTSMVSSDISFNTCLGRGRGVLFR